MREDNPGWRNIRKRCLLHVPGVNFVEPKLRIKGRILDRLIVTESILFSVIYSNGGNELSFWISVHCLEKNH